jgi:hypothetical protein
MNYTAHEMQRVDTEYHKLVHTRDKMYHELTRAFALCTSKAQRDAVRGLIATARELGRCEQINGGESR